MTCPCCAPTPCFGFDMLVRHASYQGPENLRFRISNRRMERIKIWERILACLP